MYRSTSLPTADLEKSEFKVLREEAWKRLETAIRDKGKDPSDYAVRDLQPTDLGFSNDVWSYTYSAATTEENIVRMTVGDDTFISIYAVANRSANPVTTRLTFFKGTIPLKKINIEDMYIEEVKHRLYGEDPSADAARYTLYHVILTAVKLLAPFTPHFAEEV